MNSPGKSFPRTSRKHCRQKVWKAWVRSWRTTRGRGSRMSRGSGTRSASSGDHNFHRNSCTPQQMVKLRAQSNKHPGSCTSLRRYVGLKTRSPASMLRPFSAKRQKLMAWRSRLAAPPWQLKSYVFCTPPTTKGFFNHSRLVFPAEYNSRFPPLTTC